MGNGAGQASNDQTFACANRLSGGTANVQGHLTDPDTTIPLKIDLLVVDEGGRLLVDDLQCTGKGASTSTYAPEPAPCG